MRFSARIFGFLFAFILVFLFARASFAQTTPQTTNQAAPAYLAPDTNPDVPNNLHTYTQSIFIEALSTMTCQLIGYDPVTRSKNCLGIDFKTGKIGYVKDSKGLVGGLGQMITVLYTPPAHFGDYVDYLASNFGVAKPTYAQVNGIGFTSLSPLSSVWVVFRNLVYLLFVLVFVIIGFAIMLRVKIDPRTVMTIQNQIPKIIVSLVLVTFSFAIAGLLIDFMWIITYFAINVLASADPAVFGNFSATSRLLTTAPDFGNSVLNNPPGFLGGIGGIATKASVSVSALVSNFFNLDPFSNGTSIVDLIANPVGTLLGAVVGFLVTFIVGVLAFFIIIIALIWALFKLWFALIKAYVFILIDIIFAPVWILGGLVPGNQSLGFGPWVRSMLGNLMAFPVTIGMFMLAAILADKFENSGGGQFIPPLIGNPGESNLLGALIALGIILATPNVVETTKKLFNAPKIDFGPVGENLNAGRAVVYGFAGGATSSFFRRSREGEAQGPGAILLDTRVRSKLLRGALGWKQIDPKEGKIKDEAAGRAGEETTKKA